MEVTIAWFWLIKGAIGLGLLYVIYIAFWVHKFKNTFYNILVSVLIVLGFINPVKLQPTTDKVNTLQNIQVEQTKVLPTRVTNNTFKDSTNIVGITDDDLK